MTVTNHWWEWRHRTRECCSPGSMPLLVNWLTAVGSSFVSDIDWLSKRRYTQSHLMTTRRPWASTRRCSLSQAPVLWCHTAASAPRQYCGAVHTSIERCRWRLEGKFEKINLVQCAIWGWHVWVYFTASHAPLKYNFRYIVVLHLGVYYTTSRGLSHYISGSIALHHGVYRSCVMRNIEFYRSVKSWKV